MDKRSGLVTRARVFNRNTGQWEALNPFKTYQVAMGEFALKNGREFPSLAHPERIQWNSGRPVRDFFAWGLQQAGAPGQPIGFHDDGRRKVERTQEVINEQLVFINTGINFKLNSIYWIARDKQFLECVANSPLVEANMEPQQEGVPVQPGEQPTAETPATGTETGQQPTEQQASTPGSTAEPVKTEQPATPGQPEVAPVQELKPGELKKEAPAAKPAGAGAVFDTRPAPPPKPEKPADNGTDQPSEEDERQGGVDD